MHSQTKKHTYIPLSIICTVYLPTYATFCNKNRRTHTAAIELIDYAVLPTGTSGCYELYALYATSTLAATTINRLRLNINGNVYYLNVTTARNVTLSRAAAANATSGRIFTEYVVQNERLCGVPAAGIVPGNISVVVEAEPKVVNGSVLSPPATFRLNTGK